ncbi:MAG: RHS repeat-associated core domain-containing protein [Verrucomicrobiota bacterium]
MNQYSDYQHSADSQQPGRESQIPTPASKRASSCWYAMLIALLLLLGGTTHAATTNVTVKIWMGGWASSGYVEYPSFTASNVNCFLSLECTNENFNGGWGLAPYSGVGTSMTNTMTMEVGREYPFAITSTNWNTLGVVSVAIYAVVDNDCWFYPFVDNQYVAYYGWGSNGTAYVSVRRSPCPLKIEFSPECCLMADGESQKFAMISLTDGYVSIADYGPITWSLTGPTLGCSMDSTNGIITAGTTPGTITVRATTTNGCYIEAPLEVCPDPSSQFGSGGSGGAGGSSGGGCSSCKKNPAPGSVAPGFCSPRPPSANGYTPPSVTLTLQVGSGDEGNSQGVLQLTASSNPADLYQPQSMRYNYVRSELQVNNDSGNIVQVGAPEVVMGSSNWATGLKLSFYEPGLATLQTNGTYSFYGDPHTTVEIWDVDGSGPITNQVQVKEVRGGQTRQWLLERNATDGVWTISDGDGKRWETMNITYPTTNQMVAVREVRDNNNTHLVSSSTRVYEAVGDNWRRIREIAGTGSAARTNRFEYGANGMLRQAEYADGNWQIYEYDESFRITKTYSAYLNSPPTTNSADCRVRELSYFGDGYGDSSAVSPLSPRMVEEKILDQTVSRTFYSYQPGQTVEVRCPTSSATPGDDGGLTSFTTYYTSGWVTDRVAAQQRPDGTVTLYQYFTVPEARGSLTNYYTNVVMTGVLDATFTNIESGTKTITIADALGRQLSRDVYAVQYGQSDLLVDHTSYSEFDSFGRARKTTYLDGTYTYTAYTNGACCQSVVVTNREGTVTASTFDTLGNLTETAVQTPAGILHTLFEYEAGGQLLTRKRIGANSTLITEFTATYDTAGYQLSSQDALGQTTYVIQGGSPLVRTNTYPDSSTRIEYFARDGTLLRVEGTAVFGRAYTNGFEDGLFFTQETKLLANGQLSSEWTRTYTDIFGHTVKTAASGNRTTLTVFNALGQVSQTVNADGFATFYAYNPLGEQQDVGLDLNGDGQMNYSAGTDRITRTVRGYGTRDNYPVRQTQTYVWNDLNSGATSLVSTVYGTFDGRTNWWIRHGQTTRQETYVDRDQGTRTVITYPPAGEATTNRYRHGQLEWVGRGRLGEVSYGFDEFARPWLLTDARAGTRTNWFDNLNRVWKTATPAPAAGQASQVTTHEFNERGQVWKTTLPDGGVITNLVDARGLTRTNFGARTYPAGYGYDLDGRMSSLTTFGAAGAATALWNYDSESGYLTSKRYADSRGTDYTYSPGGQLTSRTWARGITTYYTNNLVGQITDIDYSGGASNVALTLDRQGKVKTVVQGDMMTTLTYNDAGQLLTESHCGGILNGVTVSNTFSSAQRREALGVAVGGGSVYAVNYGYDSALRLAGVTNGNLTAAYSYWPNSSLVSNLVFKSNDQVRLTTTKTFDALNRLTEISSVSSVSSVVKFNYTYNAANQRTRIDLAGSSYSDPTYWQINYDALGQVISGARKWSNAVAVAGQQFEYGFDTIGNRLTSKRNGRQSDYAVNLLNQITNRTVPGYVSLSGRANAQATVTVNSQRADRQGDYFHLELPVNNTSNAVWLTLTNLAVLNQGTNLDLLVGTTGHVYVARTPEVILHDLDGNLTNDGTWHFLWDAENRLIEAETTLAAENAGHPRQKLVFVYDWRSRRIGKTVYEWSSGAWALDYQRKYVYDGWNLLVELDDNNQVVHSYVWGKDLSGSEQGAGGVGGLLMFNTYSNSCLQTSSFYCHDGNGNVAALVNAADSSISAVYEYGPFGEVIRATGPMAFPNAFRFSTKYMDDETGLLYYGHRYYGTSTGRWVNRDPIDTSGGVNIYAFVLNAPVLIIDDNGNSPQIPPPSGPPPIPVPGGGENSTWVQANPQEPGGRQAWRPAPPVNNPSGGQPSASWDNEGHWDVDDGSGNRQRYDWRGNPIDPDQAHNRRKPPVPINSPKPRCGLIGGVIGILAASEVSANAGEDEALADRATWSSFTRFTGKTVENGACYCNYVRVLYKPCNCEYVSSQTIKAKVDCAKKCPNDPSGLSATISENW